jgi:hypothetical protein
MTAEPVGAAELSAERLSLLDSLTGEWLKLPLRAMQEVGPAAQTLAGLLAMTHQETFCTVADIAARARVPLGTARKHLRNLVERGWVQNDGRGYTRSGRPRRTCTWKLTKKSIEALENYGILPWWACGSIWGIGRMPWAAKAVLCVVMVRLCGLKAAIERQDGHGLDTGDFRVSIENMGGDERWGFALRRLTALTGLTRHSALVAKRWLYKYGLVEWRGVAAQHGGPAADQLEPNLAFRVVVVPTGPGCCRIALDRGCKSG